MNARLAIALAGCVAIYSATVALPGTAQTPRSHAVQQITLDGKPVDSAPGVTVTVAGGKPESSIRRGEAIADGTRIDVPVRVVVVIVSTGGKSTTTLQPGSSVTFISTARGEVVSNNGGKTLFSVVPGSLDFFQVQSGEALTASVHGTEFSVDATADSVDFAVSSGEVNIQKSGYLEIGKNHAPVSLIDTISPTTQAQAAYKPQAQSVGRYSNFNDALAFFQGRVTAVRSNGTPNALANALRNTAGVQDAVGKYQDAKDSYHEALEISQKSKDRSGEAAALRGIGFEQWRHSDFEDALQSQQQALAIFQDIGDQRGEGSTLANLGQTQLDLGQTAEAMKSYQTALVLLRAVNVRTGEANVTNLLGNLQRRGKGQGPVALATHQQALSIYRAIPNRAGQAATLIDIGNDFIAMRKYSDALQPLQDGYQINQDLGIRDGAAKALVGIGLVQESQKKYAEAIDSFQRANITFLDTGDIASASRAMFQINRIKTLLARGEQLRVVR